MSDQIFKSIKILKDEVNIAYNPIKDASGYKWNPGNPETDKPASQDMINAMQGFVPTLLQRLKATEEQQADISVHGVTFKEKSGKLGVKVHYKRSILDGFAVENSHLPMFYEYGGDLDNLDADEQLCYLTPKEKEAALNLCNATQSFLSQVDLPIQLHLDQLLAIEEAKTVDDDEQEENEENPDEDITDDFEFEADPTEDEFDK